MQFINVQEDVFRLFNAKKKLEENRNLEKTEFRISRRLSYS